MYYLLILAVGIERLIELVVAKRNARWAFSQGGKEFGHEHYPVMVTLHMALLLGCVLEVWGLHRPVHRLAWLADARRGGGQPGAALVVYGDAGPTLEHPGHRGAGRALGATRPVPVSASPELCSGRRRRAGVAAGAHGMVDGHCFHLGELAAVEGADQGRERRAGLYARGAGDDAEHRDEESGADDI